MPKYVLNIIILLSVILLAIAFFVNPPFQKRETFNIAPIITPLPTIQNNPTPEIAISDSVPCGSPYLPLTKGKKFEYTITTIGNKNSKPIRFTNTITSATDSSAIITTQIKNSSKSGKTKIECRSSGIYGLPFGAVLLTQNDDINKQPILNSMVEDVFNSIMILPSNEIIGQKKTWSYPLKLEGIPIEIDIQGKVKNQQGNNLTLSQTLSPSFDALKTSIPSGSIEMISQFQNNLGIVELRLKISGDKPQEIVIKLDPL